MLELVVSAGSCARRRAHVARIGSGWGLGDSSVSGCGRRECRGQDSDDAESAETSNVVPPHEDEILLTKKS